MTASKKQGNLFSFFNKKTLTTPSNAKPSNTSCETSTDSNKKPTVTPPPTSFQLNEKKKRENEKQSSHSKSHSKKLKKSLADDLKVGCRLSVYWPDDKEYYKCVITGGGDGTTSTPTTFHLLYDDEETETVDLKTEKFTLISWPDEKAKTPTTEIKSNNRKRKIIEESDEDVSVDIEVESDGSEFVGDTEPVEADDDEEQTWMVTDEDSAEADETSNKKMSKRLKVTHVKPSKSSPKEETSKPIKSVTPILKTPPSSTNPIFSKFAPSSHKNNQTQPKSNTHTISNFSTPISSPPNFSSEPAPMWKEGVVNPAGSHLHNHLPFLQPKNIRDALENPPSDPNYNPRTLYYSQRQIESVSKSKLSPAQKQWWDLKCQYFDTVLLFKTGKFYEMFHMDADIGVQVLGFVYMKGSLAHAGFPESAYGYMSSKLVSAGYKVARVEQTETPAMLATRKKRTTGKKPQVVNREVCSVLSQGTRTFCYLDDTKVLERGNGATSGIGPLLAVRELVNGDNVEYGVTIVDAIRSCITLGQFADDVLRSRMFTLLATFEPCEVLLQGETSKVLQGILKSLPSCSNIRVEQIKENELFPKSTAVDPNIRKRLERQPPVHPWDPDETVSELHRRSYFPRGSKKQTESDSHIRWPPVLKACLDGNADLAISSLGAALFYLQRSLIDEEILSMGNFKAYIPPSSPAVEFEKRKDALEKINVEIQAQESGIHTIPTEIGKEEQTNHLQLDGTTLANLEILSNQYDGTQNGSLWNKLNHTKSPHGCRLLRAWLLRPLFQKSDIDRRADAMEELLRGGTACFAMSEARGILGKCPDLERLLSRVHSMGMNAGPSQDGEETWQSMCHPNERAILYEGDKYTKRKVEDFSKLLHGLKNASMVMECFNDVEFQSPLLQKIVKKENEGGCFPSSLNEDLQWFFDNFDCNKAAKGTFEPARGVDQDYDDACDEVLQFEKDLEDYKEDVCKNILNNNQALNAWKYINIKVDSRDKYMIELPVHIKVPNDFFVKGKRGSGAKQVNKYRTPVTEDLVKSLEASLERKAEGKSRGMQIIFAKFDSRRSMWEAVAQATAMLDALGSLAQVSSMPGFTRPVILNCDVNTLPTIHITQGFHPCVEITHNGGDFIPNNLDLGGKDERVLLLSGPNMGGKSTLLRQTCLISVLAQIGCYVPASECKITPIDRIFTRLGASDRILCGQSTFFVELSETAAALRGATRRSLVIMDELGRGTSTFDGTAIAHATVKHLVERNRCLALFATHYHSLLEDWKNDRSVRLGHMECMVEEEEHGNKDDCNITFLYTLGKGACPKSFGINVARLAALPKEVLNKAKILSTNFENMLNRRGQEPEGDDSDVREKVKAAINNGDLEEVERLWERIASQ